MAGKKRVRDASTSDKPKAVQRVAYRCGTVSATQVLNAPLEALDAIARDAFSSQSKGNQSKNLPAVYQSLEASHYAAIDEQVTIYGMQLLPVLHLIIRRVELALNTPILSSKECWETASRLCLMYQSGLPAKSLLATLLEALLAPPTSTLVEDAKLHAPFFLHAPCVMSVDLSHTLVAEDAEFKCGLASMADQHKSNHPLYIERLRVKAKLDALNGMLLGSASFIPDELLQRVAHKFCLDVMEAGIFADQKGSWVTDSASNEPKEKNSATWYVPLEWQPSIFRLLNTFILVCRPVPFELSAMAWRVIRHVPMQTTWRGASLVAPMEGKADKSAGKSDKNAKIADSNPMPTLPNEMLSIFYQLQESIRHLSHTLHALRQPSQVPFLTPKHTETVAVTLTRYRFEKDEDADNNTNNNRNKNGDQANDVNENATKNAKEIAVFQPTSSIGTLGVTSFIDSSVVQNASATHQIQEASPANLPSKVSNSMEQHNAIKNASLTNSSAPIPTVPATIPSANAEYEDDEDFPAIDIS